MYAIRSYYGIDDVKEFAKDKMMGDVLAVADALSFEQFDLVGHDMGAGLAWGLATAYRNNFV